MAAAFRGSQRGAGGSSCSMWPLGSSLPAGQHARFMARGACVWTIGTARLGHMDAMQICVPRTRGGRGKKNQWCKWLVVVGSGRASSPRICVDNSPWSTPACPSSVERRRGYHCARDYVPAVSCPHFAASTAAACSVTQLRWLAGQRARG